MVVGRERCGGGPRGRACRISATKAPGVNRGAIRPGRVAGPTGSDRGNRGNRDRRRFPARNPARIRYSFPVTKPTKTQATLIRKLALTETSLILHWCSADFGLVKSVAKGARRPRSPFAGKLDLFFRCEIELVPARRGDLHLLKEVSVIDARPGIRVSYRQTLTASYFVKLLEMVAESETPVPELADLLDRALNYLDRQPPDLRALRHFEKQLAEGLGVAEPGRDPARCIGDTFGVLPKQREELLRLLGTGAGGA